MEYSVWIVGREIRHVSVARIADYPKHEEGIKQEHSLQGGPTPTLGNCLG